MINLSKEEKEILDTANGLVSSWNDFVKLSFEKGYAVEIEVTEPTNDGIKIPVIALKQVYKKLNKSLIERL